MKEFERYSFAEAREEATKLEEKVKSGEAEDYRGAEGLVEKEKGVGHKKKKEEMPGPGEIRIERGKWSEFTGALKGVVSVLAERESTRMPLMGITECGRLAGAANRLESLVQGRNVKAEDFNAALRGVIGGLKEIGNMPRSREVREDGDSLTKIGSRLRQLRNGIDGVRGSFSGDEETAGRISALVGPLIEATEGAGRFVARKHQAWREYSGR